MRHKTIVTLLWNHSTSVSVPVTVSLPPTIITAAESSMIRLLNVFEPLMESGKLKFGLILPAVTPPPGALLNGIPTPLILTVPVCALNVPPSFDQPPRPVIFALPPFIVPAENSTPLTVISPLMLSWTGRDKLMLSLYVPEHNMNGAVVRSGKKGCWGCR